MLLKICWLKRFKGCVPSKDSTPKPRPKSSDMAVEPKETDCGALPFVQWAAMLEGTNLG